MNWSVFAEVIVWAVTVVAAIITWGAFMALADEVSMYRSERNMWITLAVCLAIAVIGGATLAGMYAA